MILRLVVLCLSGAGAYLLLRGSPESMSPLLRACLAVLLLVGGLGWWAVGKRSGDIPVVSAGRKPGWVDFLSLGAGVLAVECGFLWLLSVAPVPLEGVAMRIEERFSPGAAQKRANSAGEAVVSGNWLWDGTQQRELPKRTNLKPGAKPEVFVRLPDRKDAGTLLKRQMYVRAFVLSEYADGVWSADDTPGKDVQADEDGWIRLGGEPKEGILHEVFHGKDSGGRDVLTALQGVQSVRLPSLRIAAEGVGLLPDVSGLSGFEYLASSVPVVLADLEGEKIEERRGGEFSGGRIGLLSKRAAGEGDVLTMLRNIEKFLRDGYGYSLVTRNPRNLDPLENFLFEEKKGHCEFFATAGALMARELGVESRVAYGWAGGEYFKESQMFVFRAREAHAWVEVKLDGYGWVVMEPTPPVVLGGGGAPRVAGAGDAMPKPEEILADGFSEGGIAAKGNVERIALGLMGAFGIAALGLHFFRGRKQGRDETGFPIRGDLAGGYLAAWKAAFEKRSKRKGRGLTLAGQLKNIEGEPEFGDELLGYHYGVRYEEKPRDVESEARLEKRIKEWQ